MKEIRFIKNTAQGMINGLLRINEKMIYFKKNNNSYDRNLLEQFKAKGLKIEESDNWLKVDLLQDHPYIKLGDFIINQDDPIGEIDQMLYEFYKKQYSKGGFTIQETQNESD